MRVRIETTTGAGGIARPSSGVRAARPFVPLAVAGLFALAACSQGGDGAAGGGFVPSDEARAAAFKLFYRERSERVLLAYNRFGVADDAVPATTFGHSAIARQGNSFEVVPGPVDNNAIGASAFMAYKAWQALGGRPLALTLVRLFEGLALVEAVSGHPGVTCREVLPGWTRTMDGVNGRIVRTRAGVPIDPPVSYPAELEREVLDTFYSGVVVTYREDPLEFTFGFKPAVEIEDFSLTYVFSGLPRFLRISDCCSSWIVGEKGPWKGAYWGNHNSRDNFPDLALGYLAARECERDKRADADLRQAAAHAAAAGRRVGDAIVANGERIMTVGESGSYDDLIPSGQVRPDGTTEWQDLGSMASCQMAYLAKALSSEGLALPVPEVPLPGALETMAIEQLLDSIDLNLPVPERVCRDLDEGYLGLTWGEILNLKIAGRPWYEVIPKIWPDLLPGLLGSTLDDFDELELAEAGIVYATMLNRDADLHEKALATLSNLIELHRALGAAILGSDAGLGIERSMDEIRYSTAVRARMFGLEAPEEDLAGFAPAESRIAWIESQLGRPDTSPWPLVTDEEIARRVRKALDETDPWIRDRYLARFPDGPPIRRKGEGYEAVGPAGEWVPAERPRHEDFGGFDLWTEAPLCVMDRTTLDCAWASLGCARPDLDGSGVVDAADRKRFEDAVADRGLGARCSKRNHWCGGADLDRSRRLDASDASFMAAAQGCVR